ncbi:HU family DNA-binding protein [Dethiosulfovibrio salsuginis]|uniref:Bacterial nucleoid protein Hbs n=1 Tax=Dethiosulfovibrio salsuginis TaxID=561720 RepID=A0A1X7IAS5_9BACT|nr:HU family DNA-binding protein [Dethiosulfovibrio salsuginis]SMG11352.1 bacterial nucleoid protein Hbs [Dethiosulfovibrio salsuginis]
MTKTELIEAVAKSAELSKKAAGEAVSAVLESIEEALAKGEKVQLVGFGTFEVRERAARTGRNPQDPEKTIEIPAKKVPAFRPGKALKDRIN